MKYLALFVSLAACTGGAPTEAVCPPTDPPTYASFGQAFFETYCADCHSSATNDRHGAPGNQNYDTEAEILRHAEDIDGVAASGPAATNTSMPEVGSVVPAAPTTAERARLGEYLACLKAAP